MFIDSKTTLFLLVAVARASFANPGSWSKATLLSRQDSDQERLAAANEALQAAQQACFDANPGADISDPTTPPDPALVQCVCTDDMATLYENVVNIILGLSSEVAAELQVNNDPEFVASDVQLLHDQCATNGSPIREFNLDLPNGGTGGSEDPDTPVDNSSSTGVGPNVSRSTSSTQGTGTSTTGEPEVTQTPSSATRYVAELLGSVVAGSFTAMMLLC